MLKNVSRLQCKSGLMLAVLLAATWGTAASSQTLTPLVSFSGSNGANPAIGSLASDADGNLFGATLNGGGSNDCCGTVFEVAKTTNGYAATPAVLFNFPSFTSPYGALPYAGLLVDSNNDLLGTTITGGATSYGTVFEMLKTSTGYASAPSTLVNFNGSNGEGPNGGLIADSSGDLFGTTESGGANGFGAVFEVVATSSGYASTPTTLVSFDGTNGWQPTAGLVADSKGNLFGTTIKGGASYDPSNPYVHPGFGTVFEIAKTSKGYASTPITLFNFDGSVGANPVAELIFDANGNLFGTTETGGTYGYGTVFEIVKTASGYESTPTVLVNFSGSDGATPFSGLIMDAAGNLFGTTFAGGSLFNASDPVTYPGDGTVFEITMTSSGYSSTPMTLVNFDGSNGAIPYATLIADAYGNLFGTTGSGGTVNKGTVFELSGSGFVPPTQFVGTPGTTNCTGGSVSALVQTYGGEAHAAAALGYASVADLQNAVRQYCSQ